MASFQIRRATPDDAAALTALRVAFLSEIADQYQSHPMQSEKLSTSISDYFSTKLVSGEFMAWLAEKDGEIIGTSGLVFFERPPSMSSLSGRDAYIMNMYTLPTHRKMGVASALFETILAELKTKAISRVFLHATSDGRPLYGKYGFIAGHEEMEFFLT